jgi:hypothetical protein
MASSSWEGRDVRGVLGESEMSPVSEALRERLGPRAAHELEEHAEHLGTRWRDDVLQTASDRFENRLTVVTAHFENRLTAEIAGLRLEMQKGFSELRVEVLRWSFLFWIGQLAAIAALLSFMLNRVPR